METYGILDFHKLPVETQATLALGLPENSRTMRKLSGQPFSTDTLLLAGILDQLRIQSWSRTKDAKNKRNRPKSILSALLEKKEEIANDLVAFSSGNDFEAYRERLLRR